MKKRHVVFGSALALALALPLAAHAESQGFYIGGAGGADFAVDSKASTGAGHNKLQLDTGGTGLLNFGYDFGSFRTELEGAYSGNDISGTRGATLRNPGGSTETWSVMFNGFYDFHNNSDFTPYVGGGIGVGFVNASLTGVRPTGSAVGLYNGSDSTFAYQGIAGISYALTPNLSLTTDYRYFATTDAEIKSHGAKWNVENANHMITAGLRWSFGVPAPVPEPAAMVVPETPTTDFMVFFDWNKSAITPEAHEIIVKAATTAKETRTRIVVVTGHTDTSGSLVYNQRLSERRASAVKQDLIQQGISPDIIQTVGKGKTDLMVPTPDQVRDPQNRRAQIVLRIG